MEAIVTTALTGTGRHTEIETGTPVDGLLSLLHSAGTEQQLLLCAGAVAIYRQAGHVPRQIPLLPEPAPAETLPVCSPGAALLLHTMFMGMHHDLLPEALERLKHYRLRLPPEQLPVALDERSADIRSALVSVLGERGQWLSRFNPAWSWVADASPTGENGASPTVPVNAEPIWLEGTPDQRRQMLRQVRAVDPALARDWLAAAWPQEKADVRCDLLETLETGLAPADEPFLETACKDRSGGVRTIATALLARIPTSALVSRMIARATPILSLSRGKLTVTPPQAIDSEWQRDGIVLKPPPGTGERAWWLMQILALVPPASWEERFGTSPSTLVTAAGSTEWDLAIIEGWSRAVLLYRSSDWLTPLWLWWCQLYYGEALSQKTIFSMTFGLISSKKVKHERTLRGTSILEICKDLGTYVSQEVVESVVCILFSSSKYSGTTNWAAILPLYPRVWSKEFSLAYLEGLRAHVKSLTASKTPGSSSWLASLSVAARALPQMCFAAAWEPWELPDGNTWQIQQYQRQLEVLTETLRQRQRLLKAIP